VGPRRYTIKQLPPELRPRERLLSDGPEALSSAELLAILLSTGSKESTAVELAGQVISESGDLFGLHGVSTYKYENTKRSEVGFSAVLGHGASEFHLERTTLS
jgi:DNA repair protein RadC